MVVRARDLRGLCLVSRQGQVGREQPIIHPTASPHLDEAEGLDAEAVEEQAALPAALPAATAAAPGITGVHQSVQGPAEHVSARTHTYTRVHAGLCTHIAHI